MGLSTLLLLSCNKKDIAVVKNEVNGSDTINAEQSFVIDSIKISDSIRQNTNLALAYDKSVLEFPSIKDKNILDSIYKPMGIRAMDYSKNNLQIALEKSKADFYNEFNKMKITPASSQTWNNTSSMSVFSNQDNLLTLRYKNSGYTGGAHGFYNEEYKVFDLQDNRSIQLEDILIKPSDKVWEQLLLDSFNKNASHEQKSMLIVKSIPINNNFYFGNKNITFVYNQYEITAYAANVVYITLQYDDIKNNLKPEFLKRVGYK